jgi:LPXTG-site transpeptidase (sortase) family protein
VYDSTGTVLVGSAVTNALGQYSITGLSSGDYLVVEHDPSGYISTTSNGVTVTVQSDLTVTADFGDVPLGGVGGNAITGVVFNDANSNGALNAGEQALAGVTVQLFDENNALIASTTTAANGGYAFNDLPAGIYTVVETNPPGYVSTTGDHVSVPLLSGTDTAVNFGDRQSQQASIVDPAVTKFGDPANAVVGDTVIYTMTVGNNGTSDALNVALTDTLPAFLDILSVTISPDKGFVVTYAGNAFTISFGTVRPADFYTVTVLTRVNSLGRPPGGVNQVSVVTSSPNDPTFNNAASARLSIGGGSSDLTDARLPSTGFAPGLTTVLPAQPASVAYQAEDSLRIEIPRLHVNMPIVGIPLADNTWNVTWLYNQAGWLQGSAFPTWAGNSVLTGHVYLSNGLPGPFLNLGTLVWGDRLIVHIGGQRYIYEVRGSQVVSPDDRSAFRHETTSWLTLVTCKDFNAATNSYTHRVVVRAVLVKVEADTTGPTNAK